jgi:hypothetical protein
VAFHGRPRFTKDIDVFVEPSPENAERLLGALADFGFGSLGLTAGDFTSPGTIVQLGVAPNRIDLLTAIDGVTFDEAWAHRVAGPFGTATVEYISLDDLIRNKQTSARPQDLLDVEDLSTGR